MVSIKINLCVLHIPYSTTLLMFVGFNKYVRALLRTFHLIFELNLPPYLSKFIYYNAYKHKL